MLKVAVTGGIGSGKSIVCRLFSSLGIPVFNADYEANRLMKEDPDVKKNIISAFGNEVYLSNGDIHRKKLADLIFNDNIALRKINGIVHPAVRKSFFNWAEKQTAGYVIQEAAIIFESGASELFDKIITVYAPEELRIKRVMERDSVSREKVLERMNNQLSDEFKISKSDFVIVNNDIDMLIPQVLKIHNNLIS
jgi:dephospho-CoA kinase